MRHFVRAAALVVALITAAVAPPLASEPVEAAVAPKGSAKIAGWLGNAIKTRLREEFEGPGRKIEYINVSIPVALKLPENFDTFDIRIPYQTTMGDRAYVIVSFMKDSRVIAKINATAEIKMTMDVVVADRDLKKGMIMLEEYLRVEPRVAGPGFGALITDYSKIVGKQLNRNVRAGGSLRESFVSSPKMIRSGEMVSVIATSGAMTITARGKAKQDGNHGDWIKVVNIESKKTINAKVTGPGEVMVEF